MFWSTMLTKTFYRMKLTFLLAVVNCLYGSVAVEVVEFLI